VVNERQPVPEVFEPLPEADLLRCGEVLEAADLQQAEHFEEGFLGVVEGRIQRGAFSALVCCGIPELHGSILFE
jgi:hypothetical protein